MSEPKPVGFSQPSENELIIEVGGYKIRITTDNPIGNFTADILEPAVYGPPVRFVGLGKEIKNV